MSRKEIEENAPSRKDGIDLKKETYLRKSYCTFLQDLGMRLKVPQVTIATAIIFCHRFFLRQSHAKNDRRTIATVCMFLAGKVEETPRPLKDVILISYEMIHKKDPAAAHRIKQKGLEDFLSSLTSSFSLSPPTLSCLFSVAANSLMPLRSRHFFSLILSDSGNID
ncbi:Cyclin family protein [Trifolium repens]|nr:Cyclin family protein [Trifolium repens]